MANSSPNPRRHPLPATPFITYIQDLHPSRELCRNRSLPRNQVEIDSIDRTLHATWNLRRDWKIENKTIHLEILNPHPTVAPPPVRNEPVPISGHFQELLSVTHY